VLEYLLEVADSSMTYRSRYFTTLQPLAVLDVLMADETNPRSLNFQMSHLVPIIFQSCRAIRRTIRSHQHAWRCCAAWTWKSWIFRLPGSGRPRRIPRDNWRWIVASLYPESAALLGG
jgi:hypothetical protein